MTSTWLKSVFDTRAKRYTVLVELQEDDGRSIDAFELREMGIYTYCDAVLMAAAAAETENAIARQLQEKVGMDLQTCAQVIVQFRKHRPKLLDPLDKATRYGAGGKRAGALGLLSFQPMVSALDFTPRVIIVWKGEQIGTWDVPQAKLHAAMVLDVWGVTQLDQAYYTTIVQELGQDAARATNMVEDLMNFRPNEDD